MGKTKKRRATEEYEQYWKLTAAWTRIDDKSFNKALKIVVRFIEINQDALSQNAATKYFDNKMYSKLQDELIYAFGWTGKDPGANARKGINTFVKLGFIKPFLAGYHPLAKKFINTLDSDEKITIFSKIFYESASFASSVTTDNTSKKHLAFLLRTLDKNKFLTKEDIKALMITNIDYYPKGYLTKEELESQKREARVIDFEERKYNQIGHLFSFLKQFADLHYIESEGKIYFEGDPAIVDTEYEAKYHCDPIKLRIHRHELLAESRKIYNGREVCYLEKKSYKGLRDSHIKPKQLCVDEGNEMQAYDVNNGLLLSPNVDQYFDKFDISFKDDGNVLIGKNVDKEISKELIKMRLDSQVLNEQRKQYLKYHRERFYQKNGDGLQ